MANKEFYKRIKIAGMVSYIPIILVAGPLSGFFAGEFLTKKFMLPGFILIIAVSLGLLASCRETIRIIRWVVKLNQEDRNG